MKQMAPAATPSDAGFYVAVFGGANVAQDYGDRHGSASAAPVFSTTDLKVGSGSNVGGVGGIKFGYNFDSMPLDPGWAIQPAVEAEAFYLGTTPHFHYHGSTGLGGAPPTTLSTDGDVDGNLDSAAFFVNGIFRLKTGTIFTPYIGLGIGAEYMSLSGLQGSDAATITTIRGTTVNHGSGPVSGDDDVVFATQGLAGFDIAIAKNWSIFTEYKFVVGIDPSFNLGNVGTIGGTSITGKIDPSYIGQHLVNAGIKYSF